MALTANHRRVASLGHVFANWRQLAGLARSNTQTRSEEFLADVPLTLLGSTSSGGGDRPSTRLKLPSLFRDGLCSTGRRPGVSLSSESWVRSSWKYAT